MQNWFALSDPALEEALYEMSPGHTIARLRSYRHSMNPEYQRLAELYYYPGLRKAGMPER